MDKHWKLERQRLGEEEILITTPTDVLNFLAFESYRQFRVLIADDYQCYALARKDKNVF